MTSEGLIDARPPDLYVTRDNYVIHPTELKAGHFDDTLDIVRIFEDL